MKFEFKVTVHSIAYGQNAPSYDPLTLDHAYFLLMMCDMYYVLKGGTD